MNPKSAELICFLRLVGFKEREGCRTYVNFVIPAVIRTEACIHKADGTFYIIKRYSDSGITLINENTKHTIMELYKC